MSVSRPDRDFSKVWYSTYALAVILTIPLEFLWPVWSVIAAVLVVIPVVGFAIAETIAVVNEKRGDTKTEFTHYRVKHPMVRYLIGVWMGALVYYRVPGTIGEVLGIGLLIWLPLHFAIWGIEKKIWNKLTSIFRKNKA